MDQEHPESRQHRGRTVARVVTAAAKLVIGQIIAWWLRDWLG